MKKLLVAVAMVMLASPAFAAIQNVKVSGDITTTYLNRQNFDLGLTAGNDVVGGSPVFDGTGANQVGLKRQSVFITQTRVRVDADLSDNVSTEVGLINERAWGAENGYNYNGGGYSNNLVTDSLDTNVQLYLATVTLREFLYSPLTVTVGRQVFNYGNGLVMGNGGPNNSSTGNLQYIASDETLRTSYDGVTATLDYKPLTISLIYFKNQQNDLSGNPNSDKTSSDVFGYNANYQLSDPFSTVLETYMFSRIDGSDNGAAANAAATLPSDKADTLFVPGLRASTNPVKGLNVQGEVAWQLGNHPVDNIGGTKQETEHRDAMAAQFLATYSLPVLDKYKPSVNAGFTYVSGDKNATQNYDGDAVKSAKTYTAWDQFNKNQDAGTIYNTLFPFTDMYIYALGASVNPLEDVTVAATWSDLYAAQKYSTENPLYLMQPDGSGPNVNSYITSSILTPTSNKKGLGNETDLNLTYNYTEDVTFGVSVGWFVPGDVFTKNTRDTASQAIADVAVTF
jgi:hypothetical protein